MRAIRHRQRKRLSDVAEAAGVSASTVSRAESGDWDRLSWRVIAAIGNALGARIGIDVAWHGAELDRVLDEGHARIVGLVLAQLRAFGWIGEVEVSFSVYGERGSIDVLGWHAPSATLLVIEVKTELGSVEGLLRPLDAKVRLVAGIARDRFGWRAARVARIVAFPEDRTVRRQVERHRAVLDLSLPATTVEVKRWLCAPSGVLGGRWFLTDLPDVTVARNPSAVRRVRGRAAGTPKRAGHGHGRSDGPVAGPADGKPGVAVTSGKNDKEMGPEP